MSLQSSNDPRDRLCREKYFTLRPKPLERWLWEQGVPQAAERVFWLHWEQGMRSGDWCSQLSLRRVATHCCIDTSTVTRAYQLLKALELIRREDPGRDPHNPFQQATAVTEVRLPRALLMELARSPNRPRISGAAPMAAPHGPPKAPQAIDLATESSVERPTRQQIQATWGRASPSERSRYFNASRNGIATIEFDPASQLTPEDRFQLLTQLQQMARARLAPPPAAQGGQHAPGYPSHPRRPNDARPRRLSTLELARTRKRVIETVSTHDAPEVLRQIVWAVEEGALRRFDMPLALNIALKKVREGAWSRPNRMPPNWARIAAPTETCSAA
jgi:hypothetical protein